MASRGHPHSGAGGRPLPRTRGLHRAHAFAGERAGLDALARQYACTRDAAARAALVELCEPLVRGAASAYAIPGLHDDLIQEGFLGLLRAIDRYDPARGTPFLAFARHFVRGDISHYVRDHRWVLRPPRWLGGPLRVLSLDGAWDAEPDGGPTPADCLIQLREVPWEDRVVVIDALTGLRPRQRAVVFYRYFIDLTQAEVAARVGISQKQVSRLLASGLRRLRRALWDAQAAYPASSS